MKNTLFSNERLSDVMITFLNNIFVIETKIGLKDKTGYIYTGIEDVGGPYGVGSILKRDDGSFDIKINTIFSKEAQIAMDSLRKDSSFNDIIDKYDKIQQHRLLLYPINLSKKVETWKCEKRLPIIKVKAIYDDNTCHCPLQYYVQERPGSESFLLDLTTYIKDWGLDGLVVSSESGYKDDIVKFSSANYMKTVVIKGKKNMLVIDSVGVYYGKDDDSLELLGDFTEIFNILTYQNISKDILKYLTDMRIRLIGQHIRWIVPYKCGEENIIKLK